MTGAIFSVSNAELILPDIPASKSAYKVMLSSPSNGASSLDSQF